MALKNALATTKGNTGLLLNLALNYGGRSELVDAFRYLPRRSRGHPIRTKQTRRRLIEPSIRPVCSIPIC